MEELHRNRKPKRKKKQSAQSDFITLTSHQLRTPLSGVKWIIELLRKKKTGKLNRKQKEYLDKIYDSNEKMILLVNDLLEVSRLESDKTKLYLQETDLVSIINMTMREKSADIKKKNIRISLTVEPEPFPFVKTEPIKLKQAFTNILQNSITYSRNNSKISICLKIEGKSAVVEVKDTGVGIVKSEQRKIFSKFFRGSNILQFEATGTGLGLYITRAFVEASGGKIWFKSQQNKGTTIYFTLPLA